MAGRPAKAVDTGSHHHTKEEEKLRRLSEARLKCGDDKLTPPDYLTPEQTEIFDYIQTELKSAEILGNLDLFVLSNAAVCIERMRYIEIMINNDPEMLKDSKLMSTRDKYSKDFFRCCNELCLSPQARAKLSIQNVNAIKEAEDPLLDLLNA